MGAAATSAKVCVKPVVQIARMGRKEGEGGTVQMCHSMVVFHIEEPVRTVLVEKKKNNQLVIWKLRSGSL